ncbi:MAG: hemerythrin domain-containing protein [Acidobacteriota bacterium]|nr:hemerythrin domain-containing protein [Blastocatellia bacterium]MDW8239896.1 hemerythrin domain-containing protein [Acidobacteriota bacterium]
MNEASLTQLNEILREHEIVREIIWQLERLVEEGGLVGQNVEWTQRLCNELSAFYNHLERHFALEERDGYMLDVVAMQPEVSGQVEALRQQHEQLLRMVKELIRDGDMMASGLDVSVVELRQRVQQVLSLIRQHETDENALIQRVFYHPTTAVD